MTMEPHLTQKFKENAIIYKQSLDHIIEKYSKLQNEFQLELDLANIGVKTLNHNLIQTEKKMREMEKKLDESSGNGTLSHADDSEVLSGGSSLLCSGEGNPSEPDHPMNQDEDLEIFTQGSDLSEIYPSMISQMRKVKDRQKTTVFANAVIRKYCKLQKVQDRSNLNHTFNISFRKRNKPKNKRQTLSHSCFERQFPKGSCKMTDIIPLSLPKVCYQEDFCSPSQKREPKGHVVTDPSGDAETNYPSFSKRKEELVSQSTLSREHVHRVTKRPTPHFVSSNCKTSQWPRSLSIPVSPSLKKHEKQILLFPQDAALSPRLHFHHPKPANQMVQQHIPPDCYITSSNEDSSTEKIDCFTKYYHKFVCQNASISNASPCNICVRSSLVRRQPLSQTVSALSLSPRLRVVEWPLEEQNSRNSPRSEHFKEACYAFSTGFKRQRDTSTTCDRFCCVVRRPHEERNSPNSPLSKRFREACYAFSTGSKRQRIMGNTRDCWTNLESSPGGSVRHTTSTMGTRVRTKLISRFNCKM